MRDGGLNVADRKKVITGLECCILRDPDDHTRCSKCPYNGNCVNRLKMDALKLLKAQEPRVMTLEEVKRSTGETVWAERWGDSKTILAQFAPYDTIDDSFYFFTIGNSVSYKVYTEDYYKDWRCWTSRPTDEQRKAVKWE